MYPRLLATAAVGALVVVIGCINSGSRRDASGKHAPFVQKDTVTMERETEKDIYFPTAFVKAPDVKFDNDWNLRILECKADHIRVRNDNFERANFTWTATGERAAPPKDAPPKETPPQSPPAKIVPVQAPQ